MYKEDIKLYYPIKHKPREIQLEALEHTKEQIRKGKKFIMLNMPTGSGKSLFSMMFVNWYLNYINSDAKFDLLTNTKILQRQYVDEFPFVANLKGKNSYRCNEYPDSSCQEGKEMNSALKRTCKDCPYDKDLLGWKTNRIALTNFHLFNAVSLFLPTLMVEKEPNVLIIDEAHDYESVLCDFISNKLSKHSLKILGFSDSNMMTISREMMKIKTVKDFSEYIGNIFLSRLDKLMESFETKSVNYSIELKERMKYIKNITTIKSAKLNYENFLKDYDEDPNNWVIDIDRLDDKDKTFPLSYTIQPVWSHKYLKKVIWDKYDHIIFMSGTILNEEMFSYMNGIDTKLSSYYDVPSPFPIKNRPVYYIKVGKMTFNEKEKTWEKQKEWVDKIIKRNKDKKGIIHTCNYEIAGWLKEYYKDDDRFIFHTTEDRDDALQKHLTTTKPTILVSPSMTTGIDLSDDLSRFQIVLKMPYPNINSNKIKKRQEDNKEWYGMKTVMDLIQSVGRSVRNMDDFAETFILDSSFSDIMRYNYKYLPHYFTESIKMLK